jgi:hypothetical protein
MDFVNTNKILQSEDPNAINELCINSILQAAKKSIPKSKGFNRSYIKLPKYVLDLIKVRRILKNIVYTASGNVIINYSISSKGVKLFLCNFYLFIELKTENV